MKVLQAYNDILTECAEARDSVILVNMHEAFLGHGIHCRKFWHRHYDAGDPHYWYSDNLEDPNDRGYDAIRRLFLLEMARAVPRALDAEPLDVAEPQTTRIP